MESGNRWRLLLSVMLAWISGSSPLASGYQGQPILDSQAAMDIVMKLAAEATSNHGYDIQAARFEPSTHEWTIQVDASLDSNSPKRFMATVNESTDLACLALPPASGCVVQDDIRQTVADAQTKTEAVALASKHPAPDLQHLAEILLRHQVAEDRSHSDSTARLRYFVSLPSPDAEGVTNLSPEIVAGLKRDGIEALAGSAWKQRIENGPMNMRFSIGLPVRRPDGNYDVSYGYYCGMLCAGSYTAVMKLDAAGWHVVSTTMNTIS